MGRATRYCKELQDAADWYVEEGYKELHQVVPSVVGLCLFLNLGRNVSRHLRAKHPKFEKTVDRLLAKQECLLVNGGLGSRLNTNIVKLMLCNHGYGERINIQEEPAPLSLNFKVAEPVSEENLKVTRGE